MLLSTLTELKPLNLSSSSTAFSSLPPPPSTMEASSTRIPTLSLEPNTDKIKRNLLRKGVFPTPKIVHTVRKKEIQKSIRKSKRIAEKSPENPLSESQKQLIEEEYHFQTINREYRDMTKDLKAKTRDKDGILMVGKPWERLEKVGIRELASGSKEYGGEKLKVEHLKELGEILSERDRESRQWLLDDDIEEGDWMESDGGKKFQAKRQLSDDEAIRILVNRLSASDLSMQDWKFSWLMKKSGLRFTERHLLKIVGELGDLGRWRHAFSVVEWVYNRNEYKHQKSRFVYTKLLAVLGKARRTSEALHIFNQMRGDCQIYPDMPAYRSISVTLGQAGLVKELMNVIALMRERPSKRIRNMRGKNWDPRLEPDVVVFNAVLNACVPSHQWKGVSWVFEQMRKCGLKPNGATYGLAMEVMLHSGKYDLVHEFFGKMKKNGAAPNALTYRVLVRTFWEEGKVNEAVSAVRNMEQRGVVGTASVYYELACCLCKNGRWKEAVVEVEKLKRLPLTRPLEVSFTGMIMSCMDGGHVDDCISIFEEMRNHCSPNIGTINAMLKVYGRYDLFARAKDLFEETKGKGNAGGDGVSLTPDAYTYSLILEASASAHQWEYFEHVYKDMALSDYQLDQNKHAWLLVEASKAGKAHLLEHAFDMILDAGETPPLEFFTELVCLATARHDYGRAVSFVNSMAHASFQVSESQWTDIFVGNQERIHENELQKLLDALHNSEVVSDPVVSNLSKSLLSICRPTSPTDSLAFIAFGDIGSSKSTSDVDHGTWDGEKSREVQNCYVDTMDGIPNSEGNFPNGDVSKVDSDVVPVYQTNSNTVDDVDTYSNSSSYVNKLDGESEDTASDVASSIPVFVKRKGSNSFLDGISEDEVEVTLDLLTSNVNSSQSELPSASEILEEWRKRRNKDGIFFPFQNVSAHEHNSFSSD